MAYFRVTEHFRATPARAWEVLCDWEGSEAWMVDATTVEVLGPQSVGVGTRVRAVTRIAGVPLTDVMTVTAWEEERLIQVMHEGWPIRGPAWFEIGPQDGGTRFVWAEELDPPLGPLGELGGLLLRRPIEAVLNRSVRKLKRVIESG